MLADKRATSGTVSCVQSICVSVYDLEINIETCKKWMKKNTRDVTIL